MEKINTRIKEKIKENQLKSNYMFMLHFEQNSSWHIEHGLQQDSQKRPSQNLPKIMIMLILQEHEHVN